MPPDQHVPVNKAVALLRKLTSFRPRLAVVLGSGFEEALVGLNGARGISYRALGFPSPKVRGHAGRLVIGQMGGVPVLGMFGRGHFYEGLSMDEVTLPIRVLAGFGIRDLLLTNAAGAINSRYRPGEFVILGDHINFMGVNPLRGQPEFVDLTQVYDSALRKMLHAASKTARARAHEGVYLAVAGPSYETPAEIRAFRRLGADVVGMSTVPEAIVARHCGLRVAGLSCVTNLAAGLSSGPLSHAEVLATGRKVRKTAADLLRKFVDLYAKRQ